MFDDYKKEVLKCFKEKQHKNELSLNLTHPTAAKLRAESEVCFNRRFKKKDERVLKSFFELSSDQEMHEQVISRFDPDRFRPLLKFIKGQISDTDNKNVELLAWLIDYEPRPYQSDLPYLKTGENKEQADEIETKENSRLVDEYKACRDASEILLEQREDDRENQNAVSSRGVGNEGERSVSSDNQPAVSNKVKSWKSGVAVLILIIIAVGSFCISRNSYDDGTCMYWTGDEYKRIPCDKKMGEVPVYAYDSVKVATFKRITRPDTITRNAIGVVWYLKYNNQYECFTTKGNHPIYTHKKLKPITDHIIERIHLLE